ncbi:MAG: DUF2793 domain-containing protein [Planctomycetota bacterium]|jgi:hypothetical protein
MSTDLHDNYTDGVTQWEDSDMNKPLEQLDVAIGALGNLTVIDRDLTAPPGGESDGDAYIVGTSATGAWSGEDGNIAIYDNTHTAWIFAAPEEGWRCYVQDENVWLFHNGSAWTTDTPISHSHADSEITAKPYIVGMMFPGISTAGLKGIHAAVVDFTLPSGLANSQAIAEAAATAQTSISIKKNTTPIGSITFSAGGTIGHFTFSGTQNLTVGDVLKFEFPGTTPDTTLADIAITLKGSR